MNNKVAMWIDLAIEDIKAAHAMFNSDLYVHMGFMCQQAVEKVIKALCEQINNDVLPIHNLTKLIKKTKFYDLLSDDQKALLTKLQPLYIEARYPVYKARIKQLLSKEYSKNLINETERFALWIIELIKQQENMSVKSEND